MTVQSSGYDCFISYCRRDAKGYARKVWDSLEAHGVTACLDQTDMAAGDPLAATLERLVRRTPYLVLIDSPEARCSRYVRDELATAFDARKKVVWLRFPEIKTDTQSCRYPAGIRRRLTGSIWIDENGAAIGDPSSHVLGELLRVERIRQAKRIFLRVVALVSTLAIAWSVTTLISALSHGAVDRAINELQSPDVSLRDARAHSADLLRSWRLVLYEPFAEREYWTLRSVLANTVFKRRAGVAPELGAASIACDPRQRPADVAADACRAHSEDSGIGLYRLASGRVNVWRREQGWQWTASEAPVLMPFDHAAVSNKYLVVGASKAIQRVRWPDNKELIGLSTLRGTDFNIKGLQFSSDGRRLWAATTRDIGAGFGILLLDADTGQLLHEYELPARGSLSSDALTSCPSTAESDKLVGVARLVGMCHDGRWYQFEAAEDPSMMVYRNDLTKDAEIPGAVFGPDRAVAYWTEANAVVICQAPQPPGTPGESACEPLFPWGENQGDPFDIKRVGFDMAMRAPARRLIVESATAFRQCERDEAQTVWTCTDRERTRSSRLPLETSSDGVHVASGSAARDVSFSQLLPAPIRGARVTAASLSQSGRHAALALTGPEGSFIYIERRAWLPLRPSTWFGLRTVGPVLALEMSEDGRRLRVLERWGTGRHSLVERTLDLQSPGV